MINPLNFAYTKFKFPVGELQVNITKISSNNSQLVWQFESIEEIVEVGLLHHTLSEINCHLNKIYLPYVPFSRQDRSNEWGECFSLKWFCTWLNTLGCNVEITDPHSLVSPALIERCTVIEQDEVFLGHFTGRVYHIKDFWLISPDSGALKKINKLANQLIINNINCFGIVECSKNRDVKTGKILNTVVHAEDFQGQTCIIIDDICDGGKTFIEIAKVLKEKNAGKLILMVTHGFFTKGLGVFDGLIDEIYTKQGKVK